jgi:hypothetical protein
MEKTTKTITEQKSKINKKDDFFDEKQLFNFEQKKTPENILRTKQVKTNDERFLILLLFFKLFFVSLYAAIQYKISR